MFFNLKMKQWSFWQVFAAMHWEKVHFNLCLLGVWNVCLQTSWWNPQNLAGWCLRKFSKSLSFINSCQVGKLMQQNFLSTSVKEKKDSFVKFDKETDCIDTFIWQFFCGTNQFIMLWKVLKILMILYHDQATVERGFGVNSRLLVEHLHTESLIAQRHIHNHMQSYDL